MRVIIIALAAVVLPACGAARLSAQLACTDHWGQNIPPAERTRSNCINTWSSAELANQHSTVPLGQSGDPGIRQIYLPSGGYTVSRSGSTVFVNQTSRSSR